MELFIITKSYFTIPFYEGRGITWAKVTAKEHDGEYQTKSKEITKEKAMDLIQEHGLVQVLRNKYGSVWDTPDQAFLQAFGGNINIEKDI